MADVGKDHRCRRWWRMQMTCPFAAQKGHSLANEEPDQPEDEDEKEVARRITRTPIPIEDKLVRTVQQHKKEAKAKLGPSGAWPVLQPEPALRGILQEVAGGPGPGGVARPNPRGSGLAGGAQLQLPSPRGKPRGLSPARTPLPSGYQLPQGQGVRARLALQHPVLANRLSQAVQRVYRTPVGARGTEAPVRSQGGALAEQAVAAQVATVARSWQLYAALGVMGAGAMASAWAFSQAGRGGGGRGGSRAPAGGGYRYRWSPGRRQLVTPFHSSALWWRDELSRGGGNYQGFSPGL